MGTYYAQRNHPGSIVFRTVHRVPFPPSCGSFSFDCQNTPHSCIPLNPSLISTMACGLRCGCLPPPDPVPGRFNPPWSQQVHAGMAAPAQPNQNPASPSSLPLQLLSMHLGIASHCDLLAKSEAAQATPLPVGEDPSCPTGTRHQDHLVPEHPGPSLQTGSRSWPYDSPPPEYSDEASSSCLTACVLEVLGEYSRHVVPTADINQLADHVAEFIYQMCGHFAEHGSVPSWSVSDMVMPSEGARPAEVYQDGRGHMASGVTDTGTPALVDGRNEDAALMSPTDLQNVLFSPIRESRFS